MSGGPIGVCGAGRRTVLKVFLVDDHEVVRRGVADLLDEQDDLEVVGQASTVAEALARVPAMRPDVAVLDMRLPDGNGVELCRELRSIMPELNCLMLTSYTDEEAMMDAILAGAGGYVIKDIRGLDLVSAVRTVASGRSLLDNRAAAALMGRIRAGEAKPGPLSDLTEQERVVLDLIGEGLTNRQIGERMFLAEKTVKNYVSNVLAKLGMARRTQIAVLATKLHEKDHHRPEH
jgi:DNA-binding NarL/FixJ family response regulator